jgi:hypothetical protein
MPYIKHERWQLIGMIILQTALIGSLASVGINDKAQAIATVIIVATVNLPPSPLSFGMVSLHLEDQNDIGVAGKFHIKLYSPPRLTLFQT